MCVQLWIFNQQNKCNNNHLTSFLSCLGFITYLFVCVGVFFSISFLHWLHVSKEVVIFWLSVYGETCVSVSAYLSPHRWATSGSCGLNVGAVGTVKNEEKRSSPQVNKSAGSAAAARHGPAMESSPRLLLTLFLFLSSASNLLGKMAFVFFFFLIYGRLWQSFICGGDHWLSLKHLKTRQNLKKKT